MSEDSATEVALLTAIENAAREATGGRSSAGSIQALGTAAHEFANALAIVRQGRAPFAPSGESVRRVR